MLIPVLKRFESLMIRSEAAVPVSIDAYFVPRETDHRLFCELVSISRKVTGSNELHMGTAHTRGILETLSDTVSRLIAGFSINDPPQFDLQATAVFLYIYLNAQLPPQTHQQLFDDIEKMLLSYRQPRIPDDIYRSLWGFLTGLLAWGEHTLRYENNLTDAQPVRRVVVGALKTLQDCVRSEVLDQCRSKITTAIQHIEATSDANLLETIAHMAEQCRIERLQYNHHTDQRAYRELYSALRSIHSTTVDLVPLHDENDDETMDQGDNEQAHTHDEQCMRYEDREVLQSRLRPLLSIFDTDGQPSMAMHCVAVFLEAAITLRLSGRSRLHLLEKVDHQLTEHSASSDPDDPFFELLTFTGEILDWGMETLQYEAHQDKDDVRSVLVQVLQAVLSRMPSLVAYACKKKIEDAVETIRRATAATLLGAIEIAHTQCRDAILPYYLAE